MVGGRRVVFDPKASIMSILNSRFPQSLGRIYVQRLNHYKVSLKKYMFYPISLGIACCYIRFGMNRMGSKLESVSL